MLTREKVATRRAKILVVDDDRDLCELVAWALDDSGFEVATAGDGREALIAAVKSPPDAIVLDMRMPVMDGREFVEAYRNLQPPHAPIVIMTAYLDPAVIAMEVGAQGYLAKPFDLLTLVRTLRKLLSR